MLGEFIRVCSSTLLWWEFDFSIAAIAFPTVAQNFPQRAMIAQKKKAFPDPQTPRNQKVPHDCPQRPTVTHRFPQIPKNSMSRRKRKYRPAFSVTIRDDQESLLGRAILCSSDRQNYHRAEAEELVRGYLLLQVLDRESSVDRDIAVAIAEKFEALARSVRTSFEIQPPSQAFPMTMMPAAQRSGSPEAEEQSEEPEISEDEHQEILAKMP